MQVREVKKELIEKEVLILHWKKHVFLKIKIWKRWKCFVFISLFVSSGVCSYMQYFFDRVRNISTRNDQNEIQSSLTQYFTWNRLTFWPMKTIFRKV